MLRPQTRVAIATTVLIVAALSNLRLLRVWGSDAEPSPLPHYLERFAVVRDTLAPGTCVQYISAYSYLMENRSDFVLARYSLAPIRIVPEAEARLVLVNSESPLPGIDDAPTELRLRKDFGNGLRLFERLRNTQP